MTRPAFTWLTTDTHFYHDMLVREGLRPADYQEQLLRWLRYYVTAQDTLIHLGDVIFYQLGELKGMLDSIPGRKVLVRGNHDSKRCGWYMRNGFDFAADMLMIDDVLLSHKPIEVLPSGVRLNVHGHFHDDEHRKDKHPYCRPETHRLLAVEHTNYKPVKLDEFAK